ncbi:MAG: hypothetical protein ACRDFX_05025, partial [Chloroflexota bacterium]
MPPPSVHRKRLYAAHVVNGLDGVAASEIIDGIEGARVVKTLKQIDDRTDLILFQAGGSPGDLLKLRTIEDVFAVAAETGGIPAGRAGLPAITATITQSKELAGA